MAFDIVHGGYKNEHKNTHFICEILIKQQVSETSEAVEICQPKQSPLSTHTLEGE